ncbi:hypothetical protein BDY21DRAFT_103481 [Lineolata rhizophorae]|uniref:Uncharacterized protein n=1 Tax=Lineolata rhizophorae TaxID=578093 RepID=A0A6A6NRR5_9PEZI|nr:hypothetical protein BDY21DRAFT_103481 [Lineolata rhizophorae]
MRRLQPCELAASAAAAVELFLKARSRLVLTGRARPRGARPLPGQLIASTSKSLACDPANRSAPSAPHKWLAGRSCSGACLTHMASYRRAHGCILRVAADWATPGPAGAFAMYPRKGTHETVLCDGARRSPSHVPSGLARAFLFYPFLSLSPKSVASIYLDDQSARQPASVVRSRKSGDGLSSLDKDRVHFALSQRPSFDSLSLTSNRPLPRVLYYYRHSLLSASISDSSPSLSVFPLSAFCS